MIKKYVYSLLCMLAIILGMSSCDGFEKSDLELTGDCMIDSICFDNQYAGKIDLASRSVSVVLPETVSNDEMTLTALQLSEGATANMVVGTKMCLREPRVIRVSNGDVYMDWTIRTRNESAYIYSFKVNGTYAGIINSQNHTIQIYVPVSVDITSLITSAEISEGATISPAIGVATDFTNPVTYRVDNNSAHNEYVVTVKKIDKPEALFVSTAETMDQLNPEEQTACLWMLGNIGNSLYASWDDLKSGAVDMSACKVIWWHFHRDGGVDGKDAWMLYGAKAMENLPLVQNFVSGGGSLLLSRYATYLPAFLTLNGKVPNADNPRLPNNCWGGKESDAEVTNDPWSFFTDSINHPLWANLKGDGTPGKIYTCDGGYRITNSTAQWHIGTDWGGYPTWDYFSQKTGADVLGYGGDKAITVWEWKASSSNGGVICIGTGCYDWYSVDEVYGGYHDNVETITLNAFNYLMNK